jgi:hypothetical protein
MIIQKLKTVISSFLSIIQLGEKPNFMLIQLFSSIVLRYTFELFVIRMLLYYTLLPSNLTREFNFQSLIKVLWIQKT